MTITTYTKEEAADLQRACVDIELFLRLARLRVENNPDVLPLKPQYAMLVLGWLSGLVHRYKQGEDITL